MLQVYPPMPVGGIFTRELLGKPMIINKMKKMALVK
jgi:hypothetical protein